MKDRISLTDGAGGTAMEKLIKEVILKNIQLKKIKGGVGIESMDDGAVIPIGGRKLVLTTDAYTVKPIFFAGGDIGKLAVNGTLNDLAVMGAKAIAMTNAMVVEEGFPSEDLDKIIKSMN
ncbi:MAG: AIR synthase related protein, partial [Candidatus Altiarchaeota archaeon]|nr:AIR synthase related protein [Candidatus Altiarchaeota archaeon]